MKNQTQALLLICLITIVIHTSNGIQDQEPEAVETWINNIGSAKEKITKLQFYWHEITTGNNPTSIAIANSSSSASPTLFGYTTIADAPLRMGPEATSKLVGRGQGLFSSADQQEIGLLAALNIELTDGKFKGSTLSLLGRFPLTHIYREISIIGGNGAFRLARGIATFKIYYLNFTSVELSKLMEWFLFILNVVYVLYSVPVSSPSIGPAVEGAELYAMLVGSE